MKKITKLILLMMLFAFSSTFVFAQSNTNAKRSFEESGLSKDKFAARFDRIQDLALTYENNDFVQTKDAILFEGFETWPPDGWTLDSPTDDNWIQDDGTSYGPGSAYEGDYAAMYDNWNISHGISGSMITPAFDVSGIANPVVSFYWWNGGYPSTPATIEVLTSTDGTTFTSLEIIDAYGTTDWVEYNHAIETDVKYVKLIATSDYGSKNTFVDAFEIKELNLGPELALNYNSWNTGLRENNSTTTKDVFVAYNSNLGDLVFSNATLEGSSAFTTTFDVADANAVISNATVPPEYKLSLYDSYGDGWDGSTLNVSVNGTLVLEGLTIEDGDQIDTVLSVNEGDLIETEFISGGGSYDNECSYAFYDNVFEVASGNSYNALSFTAEPIQLYTFGFAFNPSTAGNHTATFTIESNGGTQVIELEGNSYREGSLVESFETAVPPNGWEANILNGTKNWEKSPSGWGAIGDYSAMFNCWSAFSGSSAELISPQMDLTAKEDNMLYFYYAHPTTNAGYEDMLKVYTSVDNGATWALLDEIMMQDYYWHLMSYDLSAYSGDEFKVKFVGLSDYGQKIYIDNFVGPKLVNGNLVGYVYDQYTGESMEGAVITLGSQTATSNSFGLYSIEEIPVGTYTVTCEFPEYKTITEEIVITADNPVQHDFYLVKPAVFSANVDQYNVKLEPNQQLAKSFTISNDAEAGADSLNYTVNIESPGVASTFLNQEGPNIGIDWSSLTYRESSFGEDSKLEGTYQGGTRADLLCPEGSVFSNNPTDYTAGITSEADPGYIVAQQFTTEGRFNTITFWGINAIYSGGWAPCNSEDPMEFKIVLYEDANGTPGDEIGSTILSLEREGTGEMFAGAYEIYQYTAMFPMVSTSTGWISIQGQTAAADDCWFLWVDAPTGTGLTFQSDGSGFEQYDGGPASMCLSETVTESWLTVTDGATGSLAPGESANVDIFFDATGLLDSTKNANIVIAHNGILPDKDMESTIPVEMIVTPFVHNVSIFDIQFTTDPSGNSPLVDTTVRTTGVITAGDGVNTYFLQDMEQTGSWTGIYLYSNNMTFEIGDKVSVVGKVTEYYDKTEIIVDPVMTVLESSGNELPAPVLLPTGSFSEQFEGVLVSVENAECTSEADANGEWALNDGTGDGVIDDEYYAYEPILGNKYNVTGPLDYSYGEFKIQPRGAGDVEDITDELSWPPLNLAADVQNRDVVLTWDEPYQYGWNGYYPGPQYLSWAGPERATYFDVTDFGFSYPIYVSSVSHGFYQHSAYPWGADTTFTVKIYDADGSTLLYESEKITALPQWNTTIIELDTTLTLTDNFWVAIAPTNTETGMPSSLGNADNSNGYVGEPGAWEPDLEWSTMVYMKGDGPSKVALKPSTPPADVLQANLEDCVKLKDSEIPSAPKYLKSYNVYRNGSLIADGITDLTYTDAGLEDGVYTYYTTTVWTAGESGASNVVSTQLFYGTLEGTVKDAEYGVPIAGATVESTDGIYTTTTDEDGNFVFDEILFGTYDFNVSAEGYIPDLFTDNVVVQDETTTVEFELDREYLTPTNVAVDPYLGIISWGSPFGLTYDDDFEDYTVGEYLAVQSDAWTTWDNAPGSASDALISDEQASSGSKSVKIHNVEQTDLVLEMGNQTSGVWEVNLSLFISPDGDGAYYNLLHDFDGGNSPEWAYEIKFDQLGNAQLAAANEVIDFTYTANAWNHLKTVIDLDNDLGKLYVNDVLVHTWQWSLQTDGTPGLKQLGAMDVFASSLGGTDPFFYFDDVSYGPLQSKEVVAAKEAPEFLYYNVYLDDFNVTETNNLSYQYEGLDLNTTYTGSVSAMYSYMGDLHESDIIDVEFTFLPTDIVAPENLVATVTNFNDIELTWDIPVITRYLETILVFRDGEEIDQLDGNTTTYTETLGAGTYEYYVQAKYTGFQMSDPSNTATAEVILPAPRNLTSQSNGVLVALQWEEPTLIVGDEFTEGFEAGFPPNGWTHEQTNVDETWEQVGTVSFSSGDVVPHEGEKQLECYWDYGDQDEWIITPEFMADETTSLTFWTYITYGSTEGDHYYLKVSSDGGTTWDVAWDASAEPAGDNHYDNAVVVDLSAYEGKNIKLAWQGYAIGGLWYAWFIDDVTVETTDGVFSFNGETLHKIMPVKSEVTEQGQLSRDGKTVVTKGNNRALTGYNIYRNDEFLVNLTATHYIDAPEVAGEYTYYIKADYNGFESDTSNNVTEDITVGISENDGSVKIYPNPVTNNELNIKLSNDIKEIKVYNYVGQVVYGRNVESSDSVIKLNTSNYNTGTYLIQFTTEDGKTITKKVVIIR